MDDHYAISMEEIIPDPFWEDLPPPPPEPPLVISDGLMDDGVVTNGGGEGTNATMDLQNQSPSEWSFERLLEEELLTDATPLENFSASALHADTVVAEVDQATTMAPAAAVSTVGDPMEYNTILKRKLDEDLAAVAMWRASSVVHSEHSQGSNNYIGGNINFVQNMRSISEGPTNHLQNAYIRARLATSSSSMDPSPSDDDDMDGEVEILGFKLPTEEKVKKRKESNRESARRSRYRKAAHLKEMEDQVSQLKVENSSLLRRLATLNQKYTDAAVDNRVLKANMETLRAKVKMAEDALKRATRTMSSSQPSCRPSPPAVPAANAADDASGPILDNIIDYLMNSTDATTADNNFEPRTTTTPSSFSQQQQAEKPPAAASTTNSAMINRIAAHHAVAVELLHKRLGGAMPPTASSGVAVATPEPAPPSDDVLVESTNMGTH